MRGCFDKMKLLDKIKELVKARGPKFIMGLVILTLGVATLVKAAISLSINSLIAAAVTILIGTYIILTSSLKAGELPPQQNSKDSDIFDEIKEMKPEEKK